MKKKKNSKLTLIKLKVSSLNDTSLIMGGTLHTTQICDPESAVLACGKAPTWVPTWGGSHCQNGSTATTREDNNRNTLTGC